MVRMVSDNIRRGRSITVTINGSEVAAYAGESLATVLLAERINAFNRTQSGKPRAPYCNMGTCFECQLKVLQPGSAIYRWMRACMTPVVEGMTVVTGERLRMSDVHPSDASHHAD